jgi:hypothetical protein
MGAEICDCVAQKASEELPPEGMQLIMTGDEALRSQLSIEETMQTGMFMVRAPGECAAGE